MLLLLLIHFVNLFVYFLISFFLSFSFFSPLPFLTNKSLPPYPTPKKRFDILKFEKFPNDKNAPPLPSVEEELLTLNYFWEGEEWQEFVCDSCFVDGVKGVRELWGSMGRGRGRGRGRRRGGRRDERLRDKKKLYFVFFLFICFFFILFFECTQRKSQMIKNELISSNQNQGQKTKTKTKKKKKRKKNKKSQNAPWKSTVQFLPFLTILVSYERCKKERFVRRFFFHRGSQQKRVPFFENVVDGGGDSYKI